MPNNRDEITSLNINPYLDDYESSRQFTQLLAVPGRVAQAREITQIQSTVKDIIKSVGNAVMKNGDIVEGCQVTIDPNTPTKAKLSEGKIYLEGIVLPVEAQEITINGTGTEIIGAKLVNILITEADAQYGQSLRDPATGYDNHNEPGCHRVMSQVRITKNDDDAVEIATIIDGAVSLVNHTPESSTLINTLARRTDDESGSYIVNGLKVRVAPVYDSAGTTESDDYNVVVEQGKAYVKGYELETGAARILTNDRSQEHSVITRKPTFSLSDMVYVLESNHLFVKQIDLVRGYKSITKSVAKDIDQFDIGSGNVLEDSSIVIRQGETTYTRFNPDTPASSYDYKISSSGTTYTVEWVSGHGPSTGNYNVKYNYETNFSSDTYSLVDSGGSHAIEWLPTEVKKLDMTRSANATDAVNSTAETDIISGDVNPSLVSIPKTSTTTYKYGTDYKFTETGTNTGLYQVTWLSGGQSPSTGDTYTIVYHKKDNLPLNGKSISIEYQYYLARKDLVCMKVDGSMQIIKGISAPYMKTTLPETPTDSLVLAIIDNPPNGSAIATSAESILVNNIGLTRFTMSDINDILNRLKVVEYDQSILSLNDEARNEQTSSKKGIFTDPLIDFTRTGYYYNIDYDNGVRTPIDRTKPIFDMAIDLTGNICYLPVINKNTEPTYKNTSTTKKYNRLVTLGVTGEETEVLSQMSATHTFKINPYSVFPQDPIVSVEPQTDSWFNDQELKVYETITGNSEVVTMSTRELDNRPSRTINNSNYETISTTSYVDTKIGERNESTYMSKEEIISQTPSVYMRRRELTVTGTNFYPGLTGIVLTMDGVRVPKDDITVSTGDKESDGKITADGTGKVVAKFTIPDKILTGTREIKLKSEAPGITTGKEGSTIYIAEGLDRTLQRTYNTVVTVLINRVTTTTLSSQYVDPVGQTFVLNQPQIVKGIDLYFSAKPTSAGATTPVICEIRGVENGTITSKVYATKSLTPSEVDTSLDSITPTRFTFDDPVLLEGQQEYAFVVKSISTAYELWVAELGKEDITKKDKPKVTSNPYMTGVMMSSSNNSSWTVHQTTDVKFKLIADTYTSTSDIIFDDINLSDNQFSRVLLLADSVIPTGTTIKWYYKLNGESEYNRRLTPYEMAYLNDNLHTSISLKATLSKETGQKISPIIALDTVSLTTSRYDNTKTGPVDPSNPAPTDPYDGYYISHMISGLSSFTKVKVIIDTITDSDTSIDVKISTAVGETETFKSTYDEGYPKHTLITGTNWKESTYNFTLENSATNCRIFIKPKSTVAYKTPAFRKLRVIFS